MQLERLISDEALTFSKHGRKNTSAFAVNMHSTLGISTQTETTITTRWKG
ncbi:MAG: hypothetical protein ACRD5B_15605 [Nitrososphaeraceae archaeon]